MPLFEYSCRACDKQFTFLAGVISDNSGPVFHDVDASAGDGGGAASGGSLIGLGGGHNSGGNAGGGGITVISSQSGNSASPESHTVTSLSDQSDDSVHQTTVTETSTHENTSLFGNSHDTSLVNSHLDNSNDMALASGNHALGF